MGGSILVKSENGYDPIKTLETFIRIAYTHHYMFFYHNDRCENSTTMNLVDDQGSIKENNEKQFLFYLYTSHAVPLELTMDTLWQIGFVDNIDGDNTKILFDFMHEYIRLNPEEYFWMDWGYLFGWREMQLLKQRPFDKYWCFKEVQI